MSLTPLLPNASPRVFYLTHVQLFVDLCRVKRAGLVSSMCSTANHEVLQEVCSACRRHAHDDGSDKHHDDDADGHVEDSHNNVATAGQRYTNDELDAAASALGLTV